MQRIFVTGGTGLVGGHVVEELLARHPQAHVVVLARSQDPRSYFISRGLDRRVALYFGDIRDARTVRDIVFNEEIDTIFHLAAQPLVTVALENPRDTLETNINGTINVLEAARGNKRITSVVVASSDKAYGEAKFLPYTEEHPLQGTSTYDASKSCEDLIAQTYAKCYGVPLVIARFGNIFGPGDLNFNRLVPGAMQALATNVPLQIRSNGQLTRDYVYVKDVARGYLLLAEAAPRFVGQAFNVTSGLSFSVVQLLGEIGRIVGRSVPFTILNQASHEIPHQSLSDQKIRTLLDWKPLADFDGAIRDTWTWYQSYFQRLYASS